MNKRIIGTLTRALFTLLLALPVSMPAKTKVVHGGREWRRDWPNSSSKEGNIEYRKKVAVHEMALNNIDAAFENDDMTLAELSATGVLERASMALTGDGRSFVPVKRPFRYEFKYDRATTPRRAEAWPSAWHSGPR